MSNVATLEKQTPLERFRMEVLPPERKQELFSGLPSHVRPERFERNLVNALMENPGLMQHDPRLVFREVSKAAALGLYLDPQLGEAYLIESWNGKAKRKEPQLRIGYRGLVKLGRQSGEFKIIYAHEVHENDTFDCALGDSKTLLHRPDVFGDRGEIVGYYAVVKYLDGETDFEPMTVEQVHAIRDRSDGWKAFKAGKIKSTPWSTDEVEMAKKTAIRRLVKRIPQSPELAEAIGIEDAAEHSEMRDITPPRAPSPPPAPRLAPADAGGPEASEGDAATEPENTADASTETVDPETGEVTEAALDEDDTITDAGAYLDELEALLSEAATSGDRAAFDDVWDGHLSQQERLFPPDRAKAVRLYQDHVKGFEGDADADR